MTVQIYYFFRKQMHNRELFFISAAKIAEKSETAITDFRDFQP